MTFLQPLFLSALILGALPILLYFLMRFRARPVPWGAEYLLLRALARRKKRVDWAQVLLLAFRTLAIMAVALAFARPLWRKGAGGAAEGVHRLVILDATASMQAEENGRSRWNRAQESLQAMAPLWSRRGEWSLLLLDDEPRWIFRNRPLGSATEIRDTVASLSPGEGAARIADALTTALALEDGRPMELYLLADDQASAWEGTAEILESRPLNAAATYWLCPPLSGRRNLAVASFRLIPNRVLRGHPVILRAEIANFSAEPSSDVEIQFQVDGAIIGTRRVSLQPWQRIWVFLETVSQDVGFHAATVRLPSDVLPLDNVMSAGFETIEQWRIGVLTSSDRSERFVSSYPFLAQTADLLKTGGWNGGGWSVVPLDAAAPNPSEWRGCDLIVLDGGISLTEPIASALERYGREGGAILAVADQHAAAESWNNLLADRGFLPARLGIARSERVGGERFRRLASPWYGGLEGRGVETGADRIWNRIRFYAWRELEPSAEAHVCHRFDDQSPFHLERPLGLRGTVHLLASGLTGSENALFVREAIYPFLSALFSDAASRAQFSLAIRRGEPLRFFLQGSDPVVGAQAAGEGEKEPRTIASLPAEGGWLLECRDPIRKSGLASMLILRSGGYFRVWYGVQGTVDDSDLTPLEPETQNRLVRLGGWRLATDGAQLAEEVRRGREGRELYTWVLAAGLLFLMGEMTMSLRFA